MYWSGYWVRYVCKGEVKRRCVKVGNESVSIIMRLLASFFYIFFMRETFGILVRAFALNNAK